MKNCLSDTHLRIIKELGTASITKPLSPQLAACCLLPKGKTASLQKFQPLSEFQPLSKHRPPQLPAAFANRAVAAGDVSSRGSG